MSPEILGVALLIALLTTIFIGFPIAFTLIFLGLVFGFMGFGNIVFNLMTLQFFSTMRDTTLAAVPLFVFMGALLEQAKMMDRLFKAFQMLLAPVRGSLYLAVLSAATVFAACTGIVGASVTLLGVMAGPTMRRAGYDTKLSAGAIAAGGTLGILIPPSVMLVVMGPVVGVSVSQLFAAAVLPGILLATLYAGYALTRSFLNPQLGPPLPVEERTTSKIELFTEVALGIIPVTVLILATLGTILAGIATPTDGAAMGAFGALLLTIIYRRLNWSMLKKCVICTLEISSMILFLVAASNFFGAVFSRLGTVNMITNALLALNLSPIALLIAILVVIFILGWPLEWVPIVLIFVPIMLPLVKQMGIDLIWFSTLVAVCLQSAWLSPPVALSAYFLKGVMPEWELKDIYLGMLQFMGFQLLGLMLLLLFPQISLWLPGVLYGR